jgi:drug/metabolite transporter (DMT)-like permease
MTHGRDYSIEAVNKGRGLNSFEVYGLAIGANLAYSSASLIYSIYAKRFSSVWINQIKVFTAFIAFLIAMTLSQQFVAITSASFILLLLSGLVGLCLGDIFIFKAFTTLGAGRSLVLYSFQPLILGIYGYFFLAQFFHTQHVVAFLCMMICVFIFMLERNKSVGHWDLKSFLWAFSGICLDALGIVLTRTAYEHDPDLQTFQVNVIRCLGALIGFLLINPKSYQRLYQDLTQIALKEKTVILSASFIGCFLSLTLYLAALKHAHVGMLTSIAITGPVWVSLLECVYYKKLPGKYLLGAFSFFTVGFYLMVTA